MQTCHTAAKHLCPHLFHCAPADARWDTRHGPVQHLGRFNLLVSGSVYWVLSLEGSGYWVLSWEVGPMTSCGTEHVRPYLRVFSPQLIWVMTGRPLYWPTLHYLALPCTVIIFWKLLTFLQEPRCSDCGRVGCSSKWNWWWAGNLPLLLVHHVDNNNTMQYYLVRVTFLIIELLLSPSLLLYCSHYRFLYSTPHETCDRFIYLFIYSFIWRSSIFRVLTTFRSEEFVLGLSLLPSNSQTLRHFLLNTNRIFSVLSNKLLPG